ncbi:MAG: lipoyl(octanoyl) transferase LipB [Gemmatimonadales bacterium]|nr:MAG: lipoyl(octanoyl) transferase LipB [Gemmatimonadales bacterium]
MSPPGSSPSNAPGRVLEARWLGLVEYGRAVGLQERLVPLRRSCRIPDQLLLLEHPHVITLGTGSSDGHILVTEEDRSRLGIEIHRSRRGGDVTYHGPGQLVGYPILDLKPDRKDLHGYLRDLEEVLIRTLRRWGIRGRRVEGLTGVWTEAGKVAALGVRVSSGWITSHGFALNVHTNLDYFGTIVPCGIPDRAVASMEGLLGTAPPMSEVRLEVARQLAEVLGAAVEEAEGLPGELDGEGED